MPKKYENINEYSTHITYTNIIYKLWNIERDFRPICLLIITIILEWCVCLCVNKYRYYTYSLWS